MDNPALSISPGRKRLCLAVLVAVSLVNQLDRQVLVIVAEPIKRELALSDTALGFLTGLSFAIVYALFTLPVGRWADRGDRARIIAGATAAWSTMCAACGAAGNFLQLVVARAGVAIGEAGALPPAQSLISDLYPPERRALAIATMQVGGPVGIFLAFVGGGAVASAYGWRAAFFAAAIPGLFVAIAAWALLPEPRRASPVAVVGAAGTTQLSMWHSIKTLLTDSAVRSVLGSGVFAAFAVYGAIAWEPSYFQRQFAWDAARAGAVLGPMVGLLGIAGTWLGGAFGDRWQARRPDGNVYVVAIAMLIGAGGFVLALSANNDVWAAAAFAIPSLGLAAFQGPLAATIQNIAPPGKRAQASALWVFAVNLLGLGFGALCVGMISDVLTALGVESPLRWALFVVPAAALASAIFSLRAGRELRQRSANQEVSARAAYERVAEPDVGG